jgi:hypothetical protein
MTPATRDLRAARNVPFGVEWRFTDQDVPLDLTGYTGLFQLRLYPGAAGAALAAGTVTIDGSAGAVTVTITEAALAAMPGLNSPETGSAQTFYHDLVLTDPTALEERWVAGKFILEPGVSD